MGVVYHAHHPLMDRDVAIKFVCPELLERLGTKMFRREIEASARVSHPNVLTAFDAGFHANVPYLVTEYLAGPDLNERVKSTGPLSFREVVRLGVQVASGLAAIHKQGIIHRDVKVRGESQPGEEVQGENESE